MGKPTIVLVPGAWHSPEIYGGVVEYLSSCGYPTKTVALPSVGAEPPSPNFNDDVAAIRACLSGLIESEGKDVVLAVHSYAGMPGNEASKDLGKADREQNGLTGGIIRLVFLAALIGFEGASVMTPDAAVPTWMKVDFAGGLATVGEDDAKDIFYHDLPPEEATKWTQKLKHQSLGVYTSPLTYAGWRHIPSTFVRAEGDRTYFSGPVIDAMLKAAKDIHPTAFDVVESTDAGHVFIINRPEWLGDVLRRAAGEAI